MLEKQDAIIQSHIATERAVDELRRQMGLVIQYDSSRLLVVCPLEFATDGDIEALRGMGQPLTLLLTGSRLRNLGLPGIDPQVPAWQVDTSGLGRQQMHLLADPLLQQPLPAVSPQPATRAQELALKLAKYASLLPALLALDITPHQLPPSMQAWHQLRTDDIESYIQKPMLEVIEMVSASLPTSVTEDAKLVSFRARLGTAVHLALVVGDISRHEAPLVRVHSSCVTGDILGSLRCDCGDQLRLAFEQIAAEGCGVLLYLHQEGRGIGINNKLRAYQLQEQGLDTYDANLMLGFDEDERDFSVASAMLSRLGVRRMRMLTNNPHKMEALRKSGTDVAGRVALVAASGRHNHAYLETKARKSGHMLS